VLRDLLIAERAATVVEIGLGYGSSAVAIAEASPVRHVVIDPFQDHFGRVGWNAIVDGGYARQCSLIEERSQLALPRLVEEGSIFDAAFVDGSHVFHNVFVDLFFLRELVRQGGLVVLDDCETPSVATAVRYFERNMRWQPQPFAVETRLRAFRLPSERYEPRFEDFEPFAI
jgi:predicted O-methyltransferase YrrM